MPDAVPTEQSVKEANRRLYDAVAGQYEAIDGRRSPELRRWLREQMQKVRERAPGGRLLDIGSGSGLVCRCAEGVFSHRVGTDLSAEILEANREAFDEAVTADCDDLPFEDGSFDAVTCFAALHHMFTFEGLVGEATRVLQPGGVFYCDHDMDERFYRRFRPLLAVYRAFHDAAAKYREASEVVTRELYMLTECHATGIDAELVGNLLAEKGFSVEFRFHWFGLAPFTDRLFGTRAYRRGRAPLVSITAVKEA
ncbi:MAG: methyltransferase domain-containing protein [Lentisphaerae bacterium]|nr:methyltransferase domain-containing protein [Lentisphaerota bacterium]